MLAGTPFRLHYCFRGRACRSKAFEICAFSLKECYGWAFDFGLQLHSRRLSTDSDSCCDLLTKKQTNRQTNKQKNQETDRRTNKQTKEPRNRQKNEQKWSRRPSLEQQFEPCDSLAGVFQQITRICKCTNRLSKCDELRPHMGVGPFPFLTLNTLTNAPLARIKNSARQHQWRPWQAVSGSFETADSV